MMIANHFYYL
jgi:WD40 repeat protein